jgi:hypothetical protein
MIFEDEHRVTLLFSIMSTLTSFIITLLFLTRFNRMATDIGSLAPGLDGHVVRSGIGREGLRKTSHFFIVGSLAIAQLKSNIPSAL